MGIDFAGPVIVKTDAVTQENSKVWLCLYTFCVVRAVDVDILFDLSVQSFIRSFKRFAARRVLQGNSFRTMGKCSRLQQRH